MKKARRTRHKDTSLVFTRESIRLLDRLAVDEFGIPSIVLMENAAIHLAAAARRMMPTGARADIYCGPGNNGGDGLAVARHLHNSGVKVQVILAAAGDRYSKDAETNLAIVRAMGIPVFGAAPTAKPDLLIDALLGMGLHRPVEGRLAELIEQINQLRSRGVPVLSVDIPSGLDADTGRPLGAAVRASTTVTLVGLKAGFLLPGAAAYLGTVKVVDIGAPRELAERLGTRKGTTPAKRGKSRSSRPR
jgi:NAD(P)H-hydrate epimerase